MANIAALASQKQFNICNGLDVNRTFACLVCSPFGRWIRLSTSVWQTPLNKCCFLNNHHTHTYWITFLSEALYQNKHMTVPYKTVTMIYPAVLRQFFNYNCRIWHLPMYILVFECCICVLISVVVILVSDVNVGFHHFFVMNTQQQLLTSFSKLPKILDDEKE